MFSEYDSVDILINNAGLAFYPFMKTTDGFEMHLVSNYLGEPQQEEGDQN